MEMFNIALRNVFRNPRRTALNLVAIGLGVTIILTMKGWVGGLSTSAYQTQIDLDTAHVQVLDSRYQEEARRLPLDLRLRNWPAVKAALAELPDLVGAGPRLDFAAQISNGETALTTSVRGVEPADEAKTNTVAQQITLGTWLTGDNQVVLGSGLARKLNLNVGDQVFLTALDQYGVRNLVDASVAGIFTTGYGIFDDAVVYTSLKKAQDTLDLGPGDATRLVLRFRNTDNLDRDVARVKAALEKAGLVRSGDSSLSVYPWREFAKGLVDTIESRVALMMAGLGLLVVLVTIGILNSMSMAVQERFQEIGTLRAIGMNRRRLSQMFLLEGFCLGLAGGLIGMTAAALLAWVGVTYGVDARGFLPREVPVPLVTVLRPTYWITDFPLAALAAAGLATLGSLLPARRAGQMVIRDVLGTHV
ncbi:MAG: FtsX-like permease family protein [Spirochaetales bacterium]